MGEQRVTDLGTLRGDASIAYGMNIHGQVVGTSKGPNGQWIAFSWKNGFMTPDRHAFRDSVRREKLRKCCISSECQRSGGRRIALDIQGYVHLIHLLALEEAVLKASKTLPHGYT